MMKKKNKKVYDDDDGRTIADMSGVEHPSMFGHMPKQTESKQVRIPEETENSNSSRPWEEEFSLTKEERKWYVLGALKAAMMIGLAFAVGLGLIVFLLTLIWS